MKILVFENENALIKKKESCLKYYSNWLNNIKYTFFATSFTLFSFRLFTRSALEKTLKNNFSFEIETVWDWFSLSKSAAKYISITKGEVIVNYLNIVADCLLLCRGWEIQNRRVKIFFDRKFGKKKKRKSQKGGRESDLERTLIFVLKEEIFKIFNLTKKKNKYTSWVRLFVPVPQDTEHFDHDVNSQLK